MVDVSAVALGSVTATLGMAWSSVHSFSLEPCSSRARMPVPTTRPAAISATTPKMPSFRCDTGERGSVGDIRSLQGGGGFGALFLVYHTEHHGNKHQRGESCENEPADHGAAKRRVLLATLPQPQGHRRHANDHGERSHQDRPETDEAGFQRGR